MITVSNLTKRYGDHLAVDNLSFTVSRGRVTGFVGPNGAGKSTTLRAMVGLTRPDAGAIRYDGVQYDDLPTPATVVGSMLDPQCVHPGRTARDHLRATAALSGLPTARVDAALAEVGLISVAERRAGGFSLGMRQRLALATALLGQPRVLLLDEPANGLDPQGVQWLRTQLRSFADAGGTVVVSSHLISELEAFVDDLVVIGRGRLLRAATLGELQRGDVGVVDLETREPARLAPLLTGHGWHVGGDGDRLTVTGATRAEVSDVAFAHRVQLLRLDDATASLERRLLELTDDATTYVAAYVAA